MKVLYLYHAVVYKDAIEFITRMKLYFQKVSFNGQKLKFITLVKVIFDFFKKIVDLKDLKTEVL